MSSDTINVYVGSDAQQEAAGMERVITHSIRSRTKRNVRLVFMRAGSPGFEVSVDGKGGSWAVGHEAGEAWSGKGWGTDFSCFRFAVPELMGFAGKAIYLDVDMIVLDDIGKLFDLPMVRAWHSVSQIRTEVSLIDCTQFDRSGWPRLEQMKRSRCNVSDYVHMLKVLGLSASGIPMDWNVLDSHHELLPTSKLAHFTTVPWQPWKPYPKTRYFPHPSAVWHDLWRREDAAARREAPEVVA